MAIIAIETRTPNLYIKVCGIASTKRIWEDDIWRDCKNNKIIYVERLDVGSGLPTKIDHFPEEFPRCQGRFDIVYVLFELANAIFNRIHLIYPIFLTVIGRIISPPPPTLFNPHSIFALYTRANNHRE